MNTTMGAAKPLVKEINHYLANLSTDQQKVVLGVVKTSQLMKKKYGRMKNSLKLK